MVSTPEYNKVQLFHYNKTNIKGWENMDEHENNICARKIKVNDLNTLRYVDSDRSSSNIRHLT